MDFWTLPNVSAPYLWDKAVLGKLQLLSPPPGVEPCLRMLLAPASTLGQVSPGPWSSPLLYVAGQTLPASPLACAAGSGPRCRADTQRRCAP